MNMLGLVPLVPAAGFVVLTLFGRRLPRRAAGAIGAASVGLACALAMALAARLFASDRGTVLRHDFGTFLHVGDLHVTFGLALDALSAVMTTVVTFVGFLIHLYAAQSMAHEPDYARFFAYMNLFVAFMLVLVLADNLVVMLVGWEGVGLCSYLLIGFHHRERKNGRAAQKAFIATRVGDLGLVIALLLLFSTFRSVDIAEVTARASFGWQTGSALAVVTALLLLVGAVGKSAQLPLHVWLPDAMAGPTPVSALIHAATMVTAGVYLIARMHPVFDLAPEVMRVVAVVGAATALYAATSALAQHDIKRVLAYSTMSQIGFMFLALGVGAYGAAIFHLFTHAFFKALLFLGAGVVIDARGGEHDLHALGGLRRKLPLTFVTFLVGAASLSALPLVTAGFFSKDAILWFAWASPHGAASLWAVGAATTVLTGIYTARMVLLAFFGDSEAELTARPGVLMQAVLVVLAFFSLTAGYLGMPAVLGGPNPFAALLSPVLPAAPLAHARAGHGTETALLVASALASIAGVVLGWLQHRRRDEFERSRAFRAVGRPLAQFLAAGWGFDRAYDALLVRPYARVTEKNRNDAIDGGLTLLYRSVALASRVVAATQTGRIQSYAMGLLVGAIACTALLLAR